MNQVTGHIGRQAIQRVHHLLDLFAFTSRLTGLLFSRSRQGRTLVHKIVMEQIYFTAVQALWIIIPVALLLGAMLIVQFSRISSQYDLGKIAVMLVVREFGPIITALIVILRSATAVTIETGYMTALNEMETIEMAGIDPHHIISLPRMVGITTAMLSLFVVFDVVAILGGYSIVWLITDTPVGNFLGQIGKAVTGVDIIVGIVKGICFGMAITATCLYQGFKVGKHITGIPVATSRAAIESLFYCLVINVSISIAFYV